MLVTKASLENQLKDFFYSRGVKIKAVKDTLEMIIDAELCEVHTHGVMLLPGIISAIEKRKLIPDNKPVHVIENNFAYVEGNNSFGAACGILACNLSDTILEKNNNSMVLLKNINHWGRAGYYAKQIAKKRRLVFSIVATAPVMNFYGSSGTRIGNNVFSCAFFQEGDEPLVIDFTTSMYSMGKLQEMLLQGETFNTNIGLNKHGNPTKDPLEIFDGGQIYPFGGHKGTSIALLIEVIIGIFLNEELTKQNFSNHFWEDQRGSAMKNDCILYSIDIDYFPNFINASTIIKSLKESLAKEDKHLHIPGQYSNYKKSNRLKSLIEIPDVIIDYLSAHGFKFHA